MYRVDLPTAGGWLSPIHHSDNGVHADFTPYDGSPKIHIPYNGQTTLGMFSNEIGRPSYDLIRQFDLGTLKPNQGF